MIYYDNNNNDIINLKIIINTIRRQSGEKPYANTTENIRFRTLPGEQPSEMLKFVRKMDSDASTKISQDQVNK